MMTRILLSLILLVSAAQAAVTERWFGTDSAGANDGTSWANRAVLISGGAFNTIITGHDFTANSLVCYVGSGTHGAVTTALASGSFANPPSNYFPLIFHGCSSSDGTKLAVPDPDWRSSQVFTDTNLPVIPTTTNIAHSSVVSNWRLIKFTASGRIGAMISSAFMDWCVVSSSTNSTSAGALGASSMATNSYFVCSGTSYDTVVVPCPLFNCRVEGNPSASSGNRSALRGNLAAIDVVGCTMFNHVGNGIENTNTATTQSIKAIYNTFVDIDGVAIRSNSTAAQTVTSRISNNLITECGTGIDLRISGAAGSSATIFGNRLRDNTTDFLDVGNMWTDANDLSAGDTTEYVNYASLDFRVDNAAAIWGKNIGAGDEAPAGGGETSATFSQ